MNWYYKTNCTHTHVRVFMNGAKCGDLCFRNGEFEAIRKRMADRPFIKFIEHKPKDVSSDDYAHTD